LNAAAKWNYCRAVLGHRWSPVDFDAGYGCDTMAILPRYRTLGVRY
jgi:hypothetical protein